MYVCMDNKYAKKDRNIHLRYLAVMILQGGYHWNHGPTLAGTATMVLLSVNSLLRVVMGGAVLAVASALDNQLTSLYTV